MKHKLAYIKALTCIFVLSCFITNAQETNNLIGPEILELPKNNKAEQYAELKKIGYSSEEIFQDLGNANFLEKNYENALFWYSKLQKLQGLSSSYQERFTYALSQTNMPTIASENVKKDWLAQVKRDYEVNKNSNKKRFRNLDFLKQNNTSSINTSLETNTTKATTKKIIDKSINYNNAYKMPISVTADGKTAYFSKPTLVKPNTGVLSKTQIVHKTYSAKKVNGKWTNVKEIALCPKYYSSVHPTISADGKRLFFASNMPGTFGKYDIYVSDLKPDGSFGIAKNLGTKVNTKKNDLYPKLVNGNSLLFASDGRKGFGGLDVYMVQVQQKKVGWSTNLGNAINSNKDDFAIALNGSGEGYVVSNRGDSRDKLQHIAFSLTPKKKGSNTSSDFNPVNILNTSTKNTDYTSSVFED